MKAGSWGTRLSLWDVAMFAYQNLNRGMKSTFKGIYFSYKIQIPTFHRPPERTCTFSAAFIKENRELGKESESKISSYGDSETKNAHMFSYAIYFLEHCTVCVRTPTHMYVHMWVLTEGGGTQRLVR